MSFDREPSKWDSFVNKLSQKYKKRLEYIQEECLISNISDQILQPEKDSFLQKFLKLQEEKFKQTKIDSFKPDISGSVVCCSEQSSEFQLNLDGSVCFEDNDDSDLYCLTPSWSSHVGDSVNDIKCIFDDDDCVKLLNDIVSKNKSKKVAKLCPKEFYFISKYIFCKLESNINDLLFQRDTALILMIREDFEKYSRECKIEIRRIKQFLPKSILSYFIEQLHPLMYPKRNRLLEKEVEERLGVLYRSTEDESNNEIIHKQILVEYKELIRKYDRFSVVDSAKRLFNRTICTK